jgi:hypothetical protein
MRFVLACYGKFIIQRFCLRTASAIRRLGLQTWFVTNLGLVRRLRVPSLHSRPILVLNEGKGS